MCPCVGTDGSSINKCVHVLIHMGGQRIHVSMCWYRWVVKGYMCPCVGTGGWSNDTHVHVLVQVHGQMIDLSMCWYMCMVK